MNTYKITRKFFSGDDEILFKGLSLEDAQAHCQDPETSSKTATSTVARVLTAEQGPWFDAYTLE